jgi:pseudaminic acid cytidylyltransferase
MRIAVIPARGGSKRIPRKNIKQFHGKPMIAWSIEAAKLSDLFDHIIVSTDDAEIANIAIDLGAEVPFIRSAELSNDFAGTTEVIAHATQWAIDKKLALDSVCCIYATAPFIDLGDIKRGCKELSSGDWDYVFTVTDFEAPIFRALKITTEGGVEMLYPENFRIRSQDLPNTYHDAGQFYWGRPSAWIESRPIFSNKSKPIVIPKWRAQDIDTYDDWLRAELIYNHLKSKGVAINE